jgi:hypothetical protein
MYSDFDIRCLEPGDCVGSSLVSDIPDFPGRPQRVGATPALYLYPRKPAALSSLRKRGQQRTGFEG